MLLHGRRRRSMSHTSVTWSRPLSAVYRELLADAVSRRPRRLRGARGARVATAWFVPHGIRRQHAARSPRAQAPCRAGTCARPVIFAPCQEATPVASSSGRGRVSAWLMSSSSLLPSVYAVRIRFSLGHASGQRVDPHQERLTSCTASSRCSDNCARGVGCRGRHARARRPTRRRLSRRPAD